MAGIDKIYLKDYNEYIYFRKFLEKHELEFFNGGEREIPRGFSPWDESEPT